MKNIFRKMIVSILSLSLVFSFSGPVMAASHAANGADIMPADGKWTSFSVRDDLNGLPVTEWEEALIKEMDTGLKTELGKYYDKVTVYTNAELTDHYTAAMDAITKAHIDGEITDEEYKNMQDATGYDNGVMGWQSYTQAKTYEPNTSKDVTLVAYNTGWDGEYAAPPGQKEKSLQADNPWGLTLTMDKIPVEFGRYYTLEFDIDSTLQGKDPETSQKKRADKYCSVKAYDYQSKGGPAASFESFKVNGQEAAKDGKFKIANTPRTSAEPVKTHITAVFKIPENKNEWSGGHDKGMYTNMGIMFALGAFAKTHENDMNAKPEPKANAWDEIGLSGYINITNLKVIAGTQYNVKYFDGNTQKAARYVNEYEQAKYIALQKKGYTQTGYVDMATGSKFSFGTLIEKDTNLKATWTKTQKPKKASFKAKSKKKKKVTLTFKKNANAKGYQVKYSHSKKFKKKAKYKTKTKITTNTKTYTIKKLKSSKVAYVKARAFNVDSCGNKVYGKWSKRKSVYVK